ncbi:MAG: serine hydrolase, partial [Pseudomonadota bacterium]
AWTRGQLNDGSFIAYGFGWGVDTWRGHRVIRHTGSWVGFRNIIWLLPDEDLSIVILGNRTDLERSDLAAAIASLYVTGRGNVFLPDESRESMIAHHRRIPDDDHWWNVRGPEQGWLHRNLQSIFPTQPIYRSGQVRELEYALDPRIGDVEIDTPDGKWPFRWAIDADFMTTMGVVILHEGKVAFESYPRMHDYEKVTYWSSTKVLAGAIIRLLEEQGKIDISKPIEYYVPRLADSVHAGTTVQNVLDMATGVDCAENYENPESCYYRYSEAIGDNLRDEDSPDDPYEFLATVEIERTGEQGTQFVYSGASNFLAMWIIEEVTGATFADALTKYFWTQIGAEHDAAILAYRYGISLSHGGFISSMRDLARLGLLYTPSWNVVSDRKIITDEHIEALSTADRPGLRPTAYSWGNRDENGWISHGGWGGQGFIVNPEKDVVAVFTSYTKQDYSELSTEKAVMQVLNAVYGDDD